MRDFLEGLGHYFYFAGRALPASLLAWRRPGATLSQLYSIFAGALPLATVLGVSLGVVVWLHLHAVISPEYVQQVPEYLTVAVVLEFAPLGAGLLVASRTGASLGAELSTLRLTEQIDALEALGRSPRLELVGPRVLSCMLTLPLLTIFVNFISIIGSYAAEALGGSLSWTQYGQACLRHLTLAQALPATLKTIVFGYLVGVSGCFAGWNASGGASGVGQAATRGVVWSLLVVLLADVVLVKLIQLLVGPPQLF